MRRICSTCRHWNEKRAYYSNEQADYGHCLCAESPYSNQITDRLWRCIYWEAGE